MHYNTNILTPIGEKCRFFSVGNLKSNSFFKKILKLLVFLDFSSLPLFFFLFSFILWAFRLNKPCQSVMCKIIFLWPEGIISFSASIQLIYQPFLSTCWALKLGWWVQWKVREMQGLSSWNTSTKQQRVTQASNCQMQNLLWFPLPYEQAFTEAYIG